MSTTEFHLKNSCDHKGTRSCELSKTSKKSNFDQGLKVFRAICFVKFHHRTI